MDIINECIRLRKHYIVPISEKYYFKDEANWEDNTCLPFVLLLGNHSSGKSSFINYLLGRSIQVTGVAPTDDSFTIIAPPSIISEPCEGDMDRNGPALVGDPDMGFSSLNPFGDLLINHTLLKIRGNIKVTDYMVVDSPGMIDSPVVGKGGEFDRGYDFKSVCRWYAERADVILLFFDPDKPGTTGETLSILTNSLQGLDHKLHIILNKADQFRKIHDFARAYGSLCWNLSKVIDRKDLPKIYTMCLPVSEDSSIQFLGEAGLKDLEQSREEVIKLCNQAPRQRIDNEISRLTSTTTNLLQHCEKIEYMYNNYNSLLWKTRLIILSSTFISAGITWVGRLICDSIDNKQTSEYNKQIITITGSIITGMTAISTTIWQRIALANKKKQLLNNYSPSMQSIPYIKPVDITNIKRILETDIANLRRRTHSLFTLSESEFTKVFSPKVKQRYTNLSPSPSFTSPTSIVNDTSLYTPTDSITKVMTQEKTIINHANSIEELIFLENNLASNNNLEDCNENNNEDDIDDYEEEEEEVLEEIDNNDYDDNTNESEE